MEINSNSVTAGTKVPATEREIAHLRAFATQADAAVRELKIAFAMFVAARDLSDAAVFRGLAEDGVMVEGIDD